MSLFNQHPDPRFDQNHKPSPRKPDAARNENGTAAVTRLSAQDACGVARTLIAAARERHAALRRTYRELADAAEVGDLERVRSIARSLLDPNTKS